MTIDKRINIKNFLIYSSAIIVLGLAIALRIAWHKPETKLPRNQQVTFAATVKTEPRISGVRQVIRVGDGRIYTDLFPRYRVGDRIRVEGEVDEKGNIFGAKIEKVGVVPGARYLVAGIREQISSDIKELLPSREATLVVGTVLGVDDIERDFKDQLIKTGTIHVVVVSGQNLSIVAGIFMALAKYWGRRLSLFLATVAVFGYALLTGFESPVMRASLMVMFSSCAIYIGRERIAVWGLLLAALVILFFAPAAIFEISFQLTFAATLGIVTLGSYLSSYLRSDLKKGPTFVGYLSDGLWQNAAIATSAYLLTAPLILYHFGQVSPIGPIANILVAFAVGPVMALGFLIAGASLIFMPAAQLLAYLAYVPAFYFGKIVAIFAQMPIEKLSLGKGNMLMVIAFYILLFILILIWRWKVVK